MGKLRILVFFCSLVFCFGGFVFGVLAARNIILNTQGSINFVADGIYAEVGGSIQGDEQGTINLEPMTIDSSIGEGLNIDFLQKTLSFDENSDEMVISLTIENKASDRTIWAKITDNVGVIENLTKTIEPERVLEVAPLETKTFSITFMMVSSKQSIKGNYGYSVELSREDLTLTPEETGLTFSSPDAQNVVSVTGTKDTTTLKEINIPTKVKIGTQNYDVNGLCAFSNRSDIHSFVMPDVETQIESNQFSGCTGLKRLRLSNKISQILASAFAECTSLKKINLPANLNQSRGYIFRNCYKLTELHFPKSYTSYWYYIVSDCYELTKLTVDPENTAFYAQDNCIINKNGEVLKIGCKTSVIPSSVKTIDTYAFYGVKDLGYYNITEGVTTINANAFLKCSNLTGITIPSTVTTLYSNSFSGCNNLNLYKINSSTIANFNENDWLNTIVTSLASGTEIWINKSVAQSTDGVTNNFVTKTTLVSQDETYLKYKII